MNMYIYRQLNCRGGIRSIATMLSMWQRGGKDGYKSWINGHSVKAQFRRPNGIEQQKKNSAKLRLNTPSLVTIGVGNISLGWTSDKAVVFL
jgi:hypothetical protein